MTVIFAQCHRTNGLKRFEIVKFNAGPFGSDCYVFS